MRCVAPDLEAAIPRDMNIGHRHPREEDRERALLAPEYCGAGPPSCQTAQLQLLARPDLHNRLEDHLYKGMLYVFSFLSAGKVLL